MLAKTHSVQSNFYTLIYSDPTSDTKCEDRWIMLGLVISAIRISIKLLTN